MRDTIMDPALHADVQCEIEDVWVAWVLQAIQEMQKS